MKKISVFTIAFLAIYFFCIQNTKAQENTEVKKLVVGVWKFGDLSTTGIDMDSEDKKEFEAMKEKSYFHFIQDGKLEIQMVTVNEQATATGEWEVDIEGKKITIINEEGDAKTLSIEEISKNKFILKEGVILLTLVK